MNPTRQQFAEALQRTGLDLQKIPAAVAAFAAERAAHLTLAAQEPGFAEAFEAEQNRVWMFAAGRAVRSADAGDAEAWGLIRGFLLGAAGAPAGA